MVNEIREQVDWRVALAAFMIIKLIMWAFLFNSWANDGLMMGVSFADVTLTILGTLFVTSVQALAICGVVKLFSKKEKK